MKYKSNIMKKILLLLIITISTTINAQTVNSTVEDNKIEVVNSEVKLDSSTENYPLLNLEIQSVENESFQMEENKIEFFSTVAYNVYKKLLSRRSKIMYC